MSTRAILLVLACAFVPMMDAFIAGVALPGIRRDFDIAAGSALLGLIMVGYLAGFGSLLIVGGRLGDRLGRRRVLWAAVCGFLAASMVCGLAPWLPVLVVGRIVQGATAAFVMPQVLGLLTAHAGSRRDRAISWYSSMSGLSALIGLIGGSALLDVVGGDGAWRWLFLINVPVGVAALLLLPRLVPDTRPDADQQIDWRGGALLSLTVLTFLLAVSLATTSGLAAVALGVGTLLAGRAWLRQQRRSAPTALVPARMFENPDLRWALALMLPFFAGAGGFLFALPQTLQEGLGRTPLAAGVLTAPMALGFLVSSFTVPRIRDRLGVRTIALGAAVQGGGLAVMAGGVLTASAPVMCLALLLIGTGQGIALGAMNAHLLSLVPAELAGMGGGVLLTAQQVSIATGTAVLGTVFGEVVQSSGHRTAMVAVLGTQILLAALVIAAGLRSASVRRAGRL
ncbi:MFS transporter [Nocardia mexicana]|uniref:Putative MFS family arabinose efflux permease n=1 Tax=Nocardia mexicana TaxID=279262 RepID=A0A370H4M0_9NOCA|nr:MFS transporter [Nocardia mexicana]RDI48976.1 putative MFS family arabinose efflux permease [Nocardia mexicana]